MSLLKTSRYFKRGLHIPELPQHSPELSGSNRTPLPGLEGDNHTGDSGLSDRNHTPLPGLEGDNHTGDSGLSGRNHTPLPGLEGEGHVTLEKLPDISKEGLHIPELPQHSPELGGSNRTPLPGLEGDNHTGDSGLSGSNRTPLPSLEGEGHVTLENFQIFQKRASIFLNCHNTHQNWVVAIVLHFQVWKAKVMSLLKTSRYFKRGPPYS